MEPKSQMMKAEKSQMIYHLGLKYLKGKIARIQTDKIIIKRMETLIRTKTPRINRTKDREIKTTDLRMTNRMVRKINKIETIITDF